MTRTSRVIKDASRYSLYFMLSQFVTVAAALLMRHFLGPVQVGVWSLVQMTVTYGQYSHLGTMQAISLEIPYQAGRGDQDRIRRIQDSIFTFSLLTAAAAAAVVGGYAFWGGAEMDPLLRGGLAFAAALILLERLNAFLICLVRAHKRFELASSQMFWSALVNAALVGLMASFFRLYGFMLAMCASYVFNILYIHAKIRFGLRFSWNPAEWGWAVRYGFPLLLLTLCTTLFETIDRIMIARFLGLRELGYYSVALMTVSYLFSIPNAIGVVLVPNLHEKFGQTQDKNDLKNFLEKSELVFSALLPLLIGISWILGPAAIRLVLPEFSPGIEPMLYLITGVYFSGLAQNCSQFLYAIKRHSLLVPILFGACLLSAGLNYAAICLGWGIRGVAIATTVTLACYFSCLFFSASGQVWGKKELLRRFFGIMARFSGMVLLLVLIRSNLPGDTFPGVLAALVVWFGICLIPLWNVEKKIGVLSILRNQSRSAR